MLAPTMTAVVTTGHGGYERLVLRHDVPIAEPGPGDVVVAVAASAVNATDINTRVGWYSKGETGTAWDGEPIRFPRIQGIDACGHVVAVGSKVDTSRIGERVLVEPAIREPLGWAPNRAMYLGSELDGAFATHLTVPSVHAWTVVSDMSDIELATFPCAYGTAENLLTHAAVKAGQVVLVTGASGGVGSAAVQLAAARGAVVVAVSGLDKAEAVQNLGATTVIGRGDDPCDALGRDTVDAVVDVVGGSSWPRLLDVLRPGGSYAVSGAVAGPVVSLDLRTLYLKDITLHGCTLVEPDVFRALVAHVEQRRVAPVVASVFPLAEIVAAQQLFESKRFVGKIVLVPS